MRIIKDDKHFFNLYLYLIGLVWVINDETLYFIYSMGGLLLPHWILDPDVPASQVVQETTPPPQMRIRD